MHGDYHPGRGLHPLQTHQVLCVDNRCASGIYVHHSTKEGRGVRSVFVSPSHDIGGGMILSEGELNFFSSVCCKC